MDFIQKKMLGITWGEEVHAGKGLQVGLGGGRFLYLKMACLGKVEDEGESVCMFVESNGKKLVLGTLSPNTLPQQVYDLLYFNDIQLTHDSKNGSVYFHGYMGFHEEFGDDSDPDELPSLLNTTKFIDKRGSDEKENEGTSVNVQSSKKRAQESATRTPGPDKKAKSVTPKETDNDEMPSLLNTTEVGGGADQEDEETQANAQSSKKRGSKSATKTPGPDKKAKSVTPEETDDKKSSGHVASSHPSKQTVKTPMNKLNQQTPKSV